jgi:hypothetical protein
MLLIMGRPLSCCAQGDAERSLERLHEAAEKDLGRHVLAARNQQADAPFDADAFQTFRKNLIGETGWGVRLAWFMVQRPLAACWVLREVVGVCLTPARGCLRPPGLTDVTASFFDKLVKQLEKGFGAMESDYAGQVRRQGSESWAVRLISLSSAANAASAAAEAGNSESGVERKRKNETPTPVARRALASKNHRAEGTWHASWSATRAQAGSEGTGTLPACSGLTARASASGRQVMDPAGPGPSSVSAAASAADAGGASNAKGRRSKKARGDEDEVGGRGVRPCRCCQAWACLCNKQERGQLQVQVQGRSVHTAPTAMGRC